MAKLNLAKIKATVKDRRNITADSKRQNAETRFKARYFIYIFKRKFFEYFEEDYELRKERFVTRGGKSLKIESDHKRLSAIRWKLSLRQDAPDFWEKYTVFILELWIEWDNKHINNLIGFMENPENMKEFYLQERIAYRKDKPLKVAGHSSSSKHNKAWDK